MSTPLPDLTSFAASTSSSGFSDGLGRRTLAFDREGGAMLDRLTIRPELAAFEIAIRDRAERIASLDHDRISHVRTMERDSEGALVVVTEFVPGTRLSDVLETAAYEGIVPGVDVALGFLLDALPVLCALHAGTGGAHGAIAPSRMVITPAGQIVLLDAVFGPSIARLAYSRQRLWQQFGIAMPLAAGPTRFDQASDVGQMALCAVMLVVGRPIRNDEFPSALPALVSEVGDVAMIRGSGEFATALQQFLQRTLPLPNRRPFDSADDALGEVRNLAREIGPAACRRAMVEFIEQLESPGDRTDATYERYEEQPAAAYSTPAHAASSDTTSIDDILKQFLAPEDSPSSYDTRAEFSYVPPPEPATAYEPPPETQSYSSFASFDGPNDVVDAPAVHPVEPAPAGTYPAYVAAESLWVAPEPEPAFAPESVPASPEPAFSWQSVTTPEPVAPTAPEPVIEARAIAHVEPAKAVEPPALPAIEETPASTPPYHGSNRKKKKAAASARAKKDKLRSVTPPPPPLKPAIAQPEPPPVPSTIAAAPPAPAPQKTWLIPPDRAAAFEPIPEPRIAPPPAPASVPHVPLAASRPAPADDAFSTRAVPIQRLDAFRPPAPPVPAPPIAPSVLKPPPPPVTAPPRIGLAQPTIAAPSSPSPVKLKMDAPPGYGTPKTPKATAPAPNIYTPPPVISTLEERSFPWKPVAAAAAVLIVALTAGVLYNTDGASANPKTTTANVPEKPAATPPAPEPAPTGKNGRIEIETQPAGARVLLDGKPVGVAPLALPNVPAGKHTLTFTSQAGSVRRNIRVEAGKTMTLDVQIFSGWVGVFAPIVLEVATNGQAVGTTDQPRIMLPPGQHELTLSNRELGYSTTQTVEIEPGEVKSITIDPRGPVNLNASPWAEVFIDGAKVGETPLANLQVPLGAHEVVFKHPKHGERKMSITVKANSPAALSVDFTK